jgi:hypothetical protein
MERWRRDVKGATSEGLERKHGVRSKELRLVGGKGGGADDGGGVDPMASACAKSSNMMQPASMLRTSSRQAPAAADYGCQANE